MNIMQEHSESLEEPFISSCISSTDQPVEASFDSGYCESPVRLQFLNLSSLPLSSSPFRMDPKMTTIRRQPFSPQKIVKTDSTEAGYCLISPVKENISVPFSPFKNSTLSPFKQIDQSPSKALDDWDKDFITNFEENLFGMHGLDGLSDSVIGELMKSPQGKALLQKTNSPVRIGSKKLPVAAGRITVDDSKSNADHHAVAKSAVVKEEPIEFYTVIKQEPREKTELHNEHNYHVGLSSTLPVTDPDKVNATPVKPNFMYDGKIAPKRNLAFVENRNKTDDTENFPPNENLRTSAGIAFHLWPSKDRLKFAREHFKQILDKTVKDKIEKFRTSQANKAKHKPEMNALHSNKRKVGKRKGGKFSRKTSKDKYPQIKKALSKPSVSHNSKKSSAVANMIIPKEEAQLSYDPGWYPDDEDSDDSDDSSWHGPVPFQRQTSYGFFDDDDDDENVYVDVDISSDDENLPRYGGKKRKNSVKGLGRKKRRT